MKISVIVSTRNRPDKIGNCLQSILANSFSDFEIIIIDQSTNNKTEKIVKKISNPIIKYFRMKEKGLDKARNLGIKKAKGKIIAFTDDDCLVAKDWLENIYLSFQNNRKISAVFGKVLSYKPEEHLGLHCAGVARFKKERIFTTPPKYKRFIFTGNALSFRRNVFEKIGFFKEWLDVGSIGMATGDEEIMYRLLKEGKKVLVNPQVVIYHDKWLTPGAYQRRIVRYTCGFFSAFGYYAFQGDETARDYLMVFTKEKLQEWEQKIEFCIKEFHPKYLLRLLLIEIPFELYYYLKGSLVAFYFAIIKRRLSLL